MARDAYLGSEEITTEPLYDPGNITIDYCELQHAGGTLNLNPTSFYVNYGIHDKSSTCRLTVLDSTEKIAELDIDGTEELILGWHSDKNPEILNRYNIYKVDVEVDTQSGSKGKLFTLHGISTTHLKQITMDINRVFNGRISDFIQKIFNNINTDASLYNVHETSGNITVIIPGETPFEAIKRLEGKAFSTEHMSSIYRLFEDTSGYRFANIERLIAENRDEPHAYVYNPNALVSDQKTLQGQYTIAELSFNKTQDLIEKIQGGAYASRVSEIDIINQKIDTTEFKVYENFNDFYHLDNPAITLDKTSIIEKSLNTINNTRWLNKYEDGERHLDFKYGPQITRRRFYGNSLSQNQMSCSVPGNSSLNPGDVINLSMLELSANKQTPEQEKKISGSYIVTSIQHAYNKGTTAGYACLLQCNKESSRANVTELDQYVKGVR